MKTWMNLQTLIKPTTTRLILEAMAEKEPRITTTTKKTIRFCFIYCSGRCYHLRGSRIGRTCSSRWYMERRPRSRSKCAIGKSERTSLPFFRKMTKEKGKGKGKGKGRYPARPAHMSLENRRRMRELKANIECRACGRKEHWVRPRQQLTDRANQFGACVVLNEFSDDPDTSAHMVGQHVLLVGEATEQVPLTPTASATGDTKDTATLDARVIDDTDGIKRSTVQRIVACCMGPFCVILRKRLYLWPSKERSYEHAWVPPSWAKRHYRIDVTTPTSSV